MLQIDKMPGEAKAVCDIAYWPISSNKRKAWIELALTLSNA